MRTFEESKQIASDALCDMEHELSVLYRTHRNYIKHGAVNAAAELQEKIEALESGSTCTNRTLRIRGWLTDFFTDVKSLEEPVRPFVLLF